MCSVLTAEPSTERALRFARDCQVPLVSELPPEPASETALDLVTVLETGDPFVITFAKSLLQKAEIEFVVEGERLQDIIGGGRLGVGFNPLAGPIAIRVRPEDKSEASLCLARLVEGHAGAQLESEAGSLTGSAEYLSEGTPEETTPLIAAAAQGDVEAAASLVGQGSGCQPER